MKVLRAKTSGRWLLAVVSGLALMAPAHGISAQTVVPCTELPGVNDSCPVWARSFTQQTDACDDVPKWMLLDRDRVFIATDSCTPYGLHKDMGLFAVELEYGTSVWTNTFGGTARSIDWAYSAAVSPDGRLVYLTGWVTNETDDIVVLAYERDKGRLVWQTTIDRGDDEEGFLLAPSPDGERIYVGGPSIGPEDEDGNRSFDFLLGSLDARTGREEWVEQYDHGATEIPHAIAVNDDGVYLTGMTNQIFFQDLLTVGFRDDRERGNGEVMWAKTYDGGEWDQPAVSGITPGNAYGSGIMSRMAATNDGVFVAATSFHPEADECGEPIADWTTLGYAAESGEQRWVKRHDGLGGGLNKANSIVASPQGDTVYVTGFASDEQDLFPEAQTIAYAASDGTERWLSRLGMPGDFNTGTALDTSPDGSTVYVTGISESYATGTLRGEEITAALKASDGTRRWISRHSNPEPRGALDALKGLFVEANESRVYVASEILYRIAAFDDDALDIGLLAYDVPAASSSETPSLVQQVRRKVKTMVRKPAGGLEVPTTATTAFARQDLRSARC